MTKDTYVSKTIGQNERIDNMTRTELKPIGELYSKIDIASTKFDSDIMPAIREKLAENGFDFNQYYKLAIDNLSADNSVSMDDWDIHQKKFVHIFMKLMVASAIAVESGMDTAENFNNMMEPLKEKIHQYDAPWYINFMDQINL
jgi:hypothetical protein